MKKREAPRPLRRQPTGIEGLDTITRGGLFRGGIYIVSGPPGVGKTILGNQACFHHVAAGHRALYVTLLAETHAQMLAYMQGLSFYDHARVGGPLRYLSAYQVIEQEGLDGLLRLLRASVREHRTDLLIVDGMMTAETLAESATAYKTFVHELQTWVGVVGCTVLLLTSSASDLGARVLPAHTMVDGIVELRTTTAGSRTMRQVIVVKFRGGEYLEGFHSYRITPEGLRVYPRMETLPPTTARRPQPPGLRVPTGVPGLDELFLGGYPAGSSTLLFGSSGSGKTLLALHFMDAAARAAEPSLYFGFFEKPDVLRDKARRLHLLSGRGKKPVDIVWQPPFEGLLDELAQRLLGRVAEIGATRVVIDGLVGFKEANSYPPRLPGFLAALRHDLSARGVTSIVTDEARDLDAGAQGISAVFDNILSLRQMEERSHIARVITVVKSRDTAHDQALRDFTIGGRGIAVGELGAAQSFVPAVTPDAGDKVETTGPSGGGPRERRGSR
jgi:circadian clock protein KaiC